MVLVVDIVDFTDSKSENVGDSVGVRSFGSGSGVTMGLLLLSCIGVKGMSGMLFTGVVGRGENSLLSLSDIHSRCWL